MKICKTCFKNKELNEFIKRAVSKDGHTDHCRECVKLKRDSRPLSEKQLERERNKLWAINNEERLKETKKVWKELNSEEVKAYEKEWHSNNKENRAAQARHKYHNDINFKIKANLRNRLNKALKGNYKSGSAVRDLGCSIEEFKVYTEKQLEPWMSWENHGKYDKNRDTWQLDHIEALANFDLTNEEELKKASHYSNYRPLKALENIKKGNK